MQSSLDWILIGGGLAGGLLAFYIKEKDPKKNILLIESSNKLGGNHTWSFHQSDLSPESLKWIKPLITKEWKGYEVSFPLYKRTFSGSYFSIRSEDFSRVVQERLSNSVLFDTKINKIEKKSIFIEDKKITAHRVIDCRGFKPTDLAMGYQKFVGLDITLEKPHGLKIPLLKDVCVPQKEGYRFFYVLPWTEKKLLIEDTRYSFSSKMNSEAAIEDIRDYAFSRNWQIASIDREERGVLPIPFQKDSSEMVNCELGMRGGFFHPTTGYSLPDTVKLIEWITRQEDFSPTLLNGKKKRFQSSKWFYRYLNRMLFFTLPGEERYTLLERFYRLPATLIARFYAGNLSVIDYFQILTNGAPPISLIKAVRCLSERGVAHAREYAQA